MNEIDNFEKVYELHNTIKLVIDEVHETLNYLPRECLTEIHSCLSHLARHHNDPKSDSEKQASKKAGSHLKRCAYDLYKIISRDTIDKFKQLENNDIQYILSESKFNEFRKLKDSIINKTIIARKEEGRSSENWKKAFDKWDEVFIDCQKARNNYFTNKELNNKMDFVDSTEKLIFKKNSWVNIIISLIITVITGAVVYFFGTTIIKIITP